MFSDSEVYEAYWGLGTSLNLPTFAENVCNEAVKLQEGGRAPPIIKSDGTGGGGGLLPGDLAGGELLQGGRGLSGR